MKTVGYYNGAMGEIDAMMIPMNDRAIYFGDGVYEAAYGARHRVYDLDNHLKRFFDGLNFLKISSPGNVAELKAIFEKCVAQYDDDGEFMLYWQCSRGTGDRSHVHRNDGTSNLLVTVRPISLRNLTRPLKVLTMPDIRYQMCRVKTLNLVPNIMAKMQAQQAGCDEALFHADGVITECAHSSLQMMRDGVVYTPPAGDRVLPGTAQKHLLKVCRQLGIAVRQESFTIADLFTAQEVIISSSGTFCVPVCQVDGREVGGQAQETLRQIQLAMLADFEEATGHRPRVLEKG